MDEIDRILIERTDRYEIWDEVSVLGFEAVVFDPGDDPTEAQEFVEMLTIPPTEVMVRVGRTLSGAYIGDEKTTKWLCDEKGIQPELLPGHETCSIGFQPDEQKWYGWSQRAIYGFSIGDVAQEGDCVCSSGWTEEYLAEHPEADLTVPVGFAAQTLDDAKRMAIAFADRVG